VSSEWALEGSIDELATVMEFIFIFESWLQEPISKSSVFESYVLFISSFARLCFFLIGYNICVVLFNFPKILFWFTFCSLTSIAQLFFHSRKTHNSRD